jgi:uncharacterized protein (UPF0276 family)
VGASDVILSVNYSVQLAELIREGAVDVGRIKCADWPDMIAAARELRPVYVHFPLDAGSPSGRPPNFVAADAMARETDTPFVNLHLVTQHKDFPDLPADSDDASLRSRVIDRMLGDAAAAVDVCGRERVILENVPYFGAGGEFHRTSVEPDVISRVVRESGCGFLLDLSHARIAAHYMGVDPHDYVGRLPVDRLRELHVTGVRQLKTRLGDHMDLLDKDWQWVEHAMSRIRGGEWATPWTVAFEYGGIGKPFEWRSEKRVLAEQVPRLRELVNS